VLRHARRGTRAIFPSHRYRHRAGGLPAWAQLLIAAAILRVLTRGPSRSSDAYAPGTEPAAGTSASCARRFSSRSRTTA
jgi:hypothetical protein